MDFTQQLQACVEQANQALSRFIAPLPFQNTPVVETMQYGALLGGKRLRPFLVYATGQMFGVSLSTLDAPAAAVECIHAYSLMHDDLPAMDDDDLRRGLPTCHVKFGEANAILAGDALQTLAFSIISDAPMPEVSDRDRIAMISELAQASGIAGMCGGQALDLEAEGHQVELDALERIHRHKTGALIRAAVRLGALSAGDKGRECLAILDKYAESIGLAFQVQDDILDVTSTTEELGKPVHSDEKNEKTTYVTLFGTDGAEQEVKRLTKEAVDELKNLSCPRDKIFLEELFESLTSRKK